MRAVQKAVWTPRRQRKDGLGGAIEVSEGRPRKAVCSAKSSHGLGGAIEGLEDDGFGGAIEAQLAADASGSCRDGCQGATWQF